MKVVIAALFFQEIALCSTAAAFLYTMMAYIGLIESQKSAITGKTLLVLAMAIMTHSNPVA
jgi:hypothetical protein